LRVLPNGLAFLPPNGSILDLAIVASYSDKTTAAHEPPDGLWSVHPHAQVSQTPHDGAVTSDKVRPSLT
jgi:hypothetical protein